MLHSRQSLAAEFNRLNKLPAPLSADDLTFGTPVVFLQGLCNTQIQITAKSTSINFKGTETVYYNRRRLDELLMGLKVPGKAADYPSTREVAAKMQAVYGVPFDQDDVTGVTVAPGATTVSLQPRGDCVGFFPQYQAILSFMG
jgi:hypothetical protein